MILERSPLSATYLGANGWLLELGRTRVLVDPWFTGPLTFGPGGWLLKGELGTPQPVPERLDLIVLSQGLADHCHPPSLALLPKEVTVVASARAAVKAERLGFRHVIPVPPGARHPEPPITVVAVEGASVPQQENGWLFLHPAGNIYLEPHGFPSPDPFPFQANTVITPVVDVGLPVAGAFVRGRSALPELLRRLEPSLVLASTTGGDVRFTGLLSSLLRVEGSSADAAAVVAAQSPSCRFIDPVPGVTYALNSYAEAES
ncbi:MAG: MBL fold metallo-hydrolase [Cyanobacteriota bacterium]|nr:MBL fold metallo-hydrolase [Cyanobacteriota bacterium]